MEDSGFTAGTEPTVPGKQEGRQAHSQYGHFGEQENLMLMLGIKL
jgi:hypothetical protein